MTVKGHECDSICVHFPDAKAMWLVGDFNNWSTTATPMVRLPTGAWEAALPRDQATGRHGFFVIGGAHPFGRYYQAPSGTSPSAGDSPPIETRGE